MNLTSILSLQGDPFKLVSCWWERELRANMEMNAEVLKTLNRDTM